MLPQIYAAQGRYREAADILGSVKYPDTAVLKLVATGARLLRAAPAAAPPSDQPELGVLNWVYLYTGAPERFMTVYENGPRIGFTGGVADGLEWAPAYHNIRQTARFKAWIRDSGILAYWRAKGWPPQCHPITATGFSCD